MGQFHGKVFALPKLKTCTKFCIHVSVNKLSGSQWSNEHSECTHSGFNYSIFHTVLHRLTNLTHSTVLFKTSTSTINLKQAGKPAGTMALVIYRVSVKKSYLRASN